jgi:hypothetical protein
MDTQQDWLQAINQTTLTPLVRQATSNDTVHVTTWTYQPVYGGAGLFANIYRFSGSVEAQGEPIPWSLILKVSRLAAGEADPASTLYWKREALIYQSGFLDQLQGEFVAPRCYAIHEPAEDEVWLWLEEVQDRFGARWPFVGYEVAARHLGAFNGHYLTEEPMPSAAWISRAWLRAWLGQTAPVMAQLPELLHHPLARRWYPAEIAQAYERLWQDRERLLSALERLPQTLCHRDAFRRNLFARRDQHGQEQTVAIDWADVGVGALGEELACFVLADAIFYETDVADLPHLDQIAFTGYIAGLRSAGWTGPERLVRLGYTTAAVLRYGVGVIQFLPSFLDETQRVYWEQALGHPAEELADHAIPIHQFLLRLADEAYELLDE